MARQDDIDALLAAEPLWRLVDDQPDGSTVLEGPAVILGPTDKEYSFDLQMKVPLLFPAQGADPVVAILNKPAALVTLNKDAHVNAGGTLCVQMPPAREIDYERDGLTGFFQQVLIHLRRIVIYALTGDYPGPAYAHGDAGKQQFRDELVAKFPVELRRFVQPGLGLPTDNQWCPCGERRRFRDCHKAALKTARAAYVASGGRHRVSVRERLKNKRN